jgi:cyanophycin synthetase
MFSLIDFYKKKWKEAGSELNANFEELAEGVWKISHANHSTMIDNYIVQLDDPVVLNIAGRKSLCSRILKEAGLTVPEHVIYTIENIDKAFKFMESVDGYFVVKPSNFTSGGRGISTHIKTKKECKRASALASLYSEEIIIERLIPGESYRLLILNGSMIQASRRSGLRIKGDGSSTIKELIAGKMCEFTKGSINHYLPNIDRDLDATLSAQGLTIETIPEPCAEVLAKSNCKYTDRYVEFRTVYNEDVTAVISSKLKAQAECAAKALGSIFAGVDIITLDPSLPLEDTGGAIVEVNTTPGLHHHYNLLNGPEISPAVQVLKYLLKID